MRLRTTRRLSFFAQRITAMSLLVTMTAPAFAQQPQQPPKAAPAAPGGKGTKGTAPAQPAAPAAPPADADPNNASSEGMTDEAKKEIAKKSFDSGVKFMEDGAFDVALTEFRKSFATYPTRSAGRNLGVCLKSLGRYDEASDMLEQVLRDFEKNMKPEDREFVVRTLDELKKLVGFIDVRVTEQGATIMVDSVERGHSPTKPVRVPAGTHTVRVSKEGFLPYDGRIVVPREGTVTVDAKLGAMLQGGRLSVSEDQGKALDVVVDGVVVGKSPWAGTVAVGKHAVLLRGEGNIGSPPATADIKLNSLAKVTLLAEPVPCKLRVTPSPINGLVAVDGVEVGQGIWSGNLRCGGHRIDVTADGFVTQQKVVSLSEEREGVEAIALERDPQYNKIPSRIITGGSMDLLFASTGGDPSSACTGICSSGLGLGGMFSAYGGYRFGSGIGAALTAGYMFMQKSYTGRAAVAEPVGFPVNQGTSNDSISLRGPHIGISASYERGEKWKYGFKLSGGVVLATWSSTRDATLTTTVQNGSLTFSRRI